LAAGQNVRSLDTTRPQRQYYASYASPTVSPYVNLGTNANGVSNYQSLVRPMIEERAALERQALALEQINQRMRGPAARRQPPVNTDAPPGRTSVRFMDYSRYLGTTW
jgi:hypothetical protein